MYIVHQICEPAIANWAGQMEQTGIEEWVRWIRLQTHDTLPSCRYPLRSTLCVTRLWHPCNALHIHKYRGVGQTDQAIDSRHIAQSPSDPHATHSVLHDLRCHDMQCTLKFFVHNYSYNRLAPYSKLGGQNHDSLMRRALLSNVISKFVSRSNSYSVRAHNFV